MTTLIEVRTSRGVVGHCDAKCYDAKHDDCVCVCGGRNHGKGHEKACENVRADWEAMTKQYADMLDLSDWEAMVNTTVVNQLRLPLQNRISASSRSSEH